MGAYEACEGRLIEQWRSLWLTGNDIVREVMASRDAREATKEFTELVVTPEMRAGAIWDRSYAKPMGYPGDFQIMNQVYDWERAGRECLSAADPSPRPGSGRMHQTRACMWCARKIAETVRERGQERPARILSLGSGPAREIETFLEGPQPRGGKAEFTLVDQETQALGYAYDRTYPALLKLGGWRGCNA